MLAFFSNSHTRPDYIKSNKDQNGVSDYERILYNLNFAHVGNKTIL
jgi:hypothetical protein